MTPTGTQKISRGQFGFTLVELMVSVSLAAGIGVYSLYWQNISDKISKGQYLGQQYVAINDAVNNYMVTHSKTLSALDPVCSETTFQWDADELDTFYPSIGASKERLAANCSMSVNTVTIANGLQPTLTELTSLGFLSKQNTYQPILLMQSRVKEAASDGKAPDKDSLPTQARFFVNIEQVCIPRSNVSKVSNNSDDSEGQSLNSVKGSMGCGSDTTTALKSLVFNTQPYILNLESSTLGNPALLSSAITKIGADAAYSSFRNDGYAYQGELNGGSFTVRNPIRYINASDPSAIIDRGITGIIAVKGGYGAAYANQHARVDGSNLPTADWNFAGHSMNDVKDFTATNQVKAKDLTASNSVVTPSLTAASAIQTNVLTASSAITSSSIMAKDLATTNTVSTSAMTASTIATNTLTTNKLKLPTVTAGAPCTAASESIAINGDKLLYCGTGTKDTDKVWKSYLAGTVDVTDYYEITFTEDAKNVKSSTYIRCTSGTCTAPTTISYTTTLPRVITTNLATNLWHPVIHSFDLKNPASSTLDTNLAITFSATSTAKHQISLNYQTADVVKFVTRFYAINQ